MKRYTYDGSSFFFSEEKKNFKTAQLECANINATLAVVKSIDEYAFLLNHMAKMSEYWIWLVKKQGCNTSGTSAQNGSKGRSFNVVVVLILK